MESARTTVFDSMIRVSRDGTVTSPEIRMVSSQTVLFSSGESVPDHLP